MREVRKWEGENELGSRFWRETRGACVGRTNQMHSQIGGSKEAKTGKNHYISMTRWSVDTEKGEKWAEWWFACAMTSINSICSQVVVSGLPASALKGACFIGVRHERWNQVLGRHGRPGASCYGVPRLQYPNHSHCGTVAPSCLQLSFTVDQFLRLPAQNRRFPFLPTSSTSCISSSCTSCASCTSSTAE